MQTRRQKNNLTYFPSSQEQKRQLMEREANQLSRLIQKERAKLPKVTYGSNKLRELELRLQAIYNTVD